MASRPLAREFIDDDIEIYADETRERVLMTWHNLRQQNAEAVRQPEPVPRGLRGAQGFGRGRLRGRLRGHRGLGIDAKVTRVRGEERRLRAIMLKALADRLAEAFAEHLHHRVRTEFWGYDAAEKLSNDDLIAEKYRGIRPAPATPRARPHREGRLFGLLDAGKNADMTAHRVLRDAARPRR
jgi:5-methyltetrahydrofolate--homocysteine methyltransferase